MKQRELGSELFVLRVLGLALEEVPHMLNTVHCRNEQCWSEIEGLAFLSHAGVKGFWKRSVIVESDEHDSYPAGQSLFNRRISSRHLS
jgi:hypothetical protein